MSSINVAGTGISNRSFTPSSASKAPSQADFLKSGLLGKEGITQSDINSIVAHLSDLGKAISKGVPFLTFDFESQATSALKQFSLDKKINRKTFKPIPAIPDADVFRKKDVAASLKEYLLPENVVSRLETLVRDKIATVDKGAGRSQMSRELKAELQLQLKLEQERLGSLDPAQQGALKDLKKGIDKIFKDLSKIDLDTLTLPDDKEVKS